MDKAVFGEYDADNILKDLTFGRAFAFVEAFNGVATFVVVVNIVMYDKFKAANIAALCGGDFKGVRDRIWPLIVQWMKDNGISKVEASVSDPMYRLCKRLFGFDKVYNHIRLDLGDSNVS